MLACEKKWHKQCFKCTLPGCGRVLAKGGYLEKDGMPYEQLYLFIKIPNSTFYFSDLLCMNNKAIVVDRHYTPCFYPSWLHIRARPCHHQRTVPDPHLPLFTLFFLFFFPKGTARSLALHRCRALEASALGVEVAQASATVPPAKLPRSEASSLFIIQGKLLVFFYTFLSFFLHINTITNKKSICKLPHCTGHPRVS